MAQEKQALISTDGIGYFVTHARSVDPSQSTTTDPSHIHSDVEIYLKVSGDISFLVRNAVYPISRGDVILTRAGEMHHCIYQSARMHDHFCLWLSDSEGGELLSFLAESDINYIHLPEEEREQLIHRFYRLHKMFEDKDRLGAGAEILGILSVLRKGMREGSVGQKLAVPAGFQEILDHIQENCGEFANVSDLVERFFISPSTMNRWFSQYLHMTPKGYLESVKLSRAQRLLREGMSVTDVCFACGYCDSSHFIRAFKRKFSKTPGQFRGEILKNT